MLLLSLFGLDATYSWGRPFIHILLKSWSIKKFLEWQKSVVSLARRWYLKTLVFMVFFFFPCTPAAFYENIHIGIKKRHTMKFKSVGWKRSTSLNEFSSCNNFRIASVNSQGSFYWMKDCGCIKIEYFCAIWNLCFLRCCVSNLVAMNNNKMGYCSNKGSGLFKFALSYVVTWCESGNM